MIFNISVLVVTLSVFLNGVIGASYSKVYVSSGQEGVPLEYIQYGAPTVSIPGPQLAQISAAPIGSVVPVASSASVIAPCGVPCVYPGPALSSISQIATPNFVTYQSNLPVVVTNNEEASAYEYSYVVYDEGTGDHKAQHELSDGAVVRGEYSLIQPDGFVREVHYTADDLKGFNAIVKKFLPIHVESKKEDKEEQHPAPPCHEVKNESLKTTELQEKHEDTHAPESHAEDNHQETHEVAPISESHEIVKDEHVHSTEETKGKKSEALIEGPAKSDEEKSSSTEEKIVSSEKKVASEESHEHESEPQHEEHDSKPQVEENAAEVHGEPRTSDAQYDIIKCVQAAINNKDNVQAPLTYIILNRPC